MTPERCLYTLIHAPRENHERLLHDLVIPVVREVRRSPELHSLFFVRYAEPDWQLRFRILGAPEWVDATARALVATRLLVLREGGLVDSWEFATYQREYDRYGGEEGMRLCEGIFLQDSLASLDLIEAESRGLLEKSRREYSLVFVERFLDLMRFDRQRRIAFYRQGYSWALDEGGWEAGDLRLLEERYQGLKDGLIALFRGDSSRDPVSLFGGAQPARIARACLDAMRPIAEEILAAHSDGRLRQDLVHLAWSLTHMHCNRLAVETSAEAVIRFFMHRLHQEEAIV
jgi:thiopeptide-type bacteriocin biosynthesis protein